MSLVLAWADLRARLAAAALVSGGQPVPVCEPNTSFAAPPGNRPWLRADVSGGAGQPIELGAEAWEDQGMAFIDVLVRVGTGVDATAALVDALKSAFRGPPFAPITYTRIAADLVGSGDDDGEYFITSVRAEWRLTTHAIPRS